MDAALFAVAESQSGLFTTGQALAAGVTEAGLAGLKKQRVVSSIARSVYAIADAVPTDPLDRHRLKLAASVLLYPDARPCGVSLLANRGIDVWGADLSRVDLVRDVSSEVLTGLCRIRRPYPAVRPSVDIDIASGGNARLCEAVAAAVVQTALDHGALPAIISADDALQDGLTTVDAIVAAAASVIRWPGAGKVRTMLAMMDGRSQSVGESRLRVMLTIAGLRLVPQFPISDDGADMPFAYADLLVDGSNLLLEFDGKVKYGSQEALWREKKREDRIRRRGYRIERVIWADLERPKVLIPRIRREVRMSESRPSVVAPAAPSAPSAPSGA